MGKGGGCGASKYTAGVSPSVAEFLEAAWLAQDKAVVKALSRHGVTLKVLQQLLDEGCLREELSKLGIQGIPARAIETTLLEWNTKGRANATQEVRGNQVGSEVAASDDGEGRPHDAGVVIDKLAAAKEDVSQLKAAAPIDEDASLTSVITNGGLADAIVTALRPVMHVLEGVPLVGTVARLVSGAISGVAHVRVAEQAVGEYQALVSGVPDLLAAAAGTLGDNHAAQEILRGMRDALAAGNEVVGVLMSRGWLGKWVRAPRDAGDLEGTSRRIADLLSQLTLAASLEGTRTAQNVNAAVARMNEAMQSGILSLAPIRDAISRALDDAGGIEAVRADLSGEKLKEVEKKLPAEFQAVAGRAAAAEAALIKEADMLAGKVRARVENLRERLMGELIEEIGALRIKELPPVLESLWRECLSPFDPEVPWEEFRDAASTSTLGVRGSSVSLENWFRDNTEHDIEEFLEATLRPRMVQRSTAKDRATVGDLCGLSRRAELRLRLKRENVDLSSLAILLGVASASPAQTETPEGDKAFSEDVAVRLEGWQAGTREWLVERVLGWVDGSQTGGVGEAGGRRTFVLLSGPGMGKTALAAHIARQLLVRGDLLAGHFVRAGDEDRIDPRHVLRSLARQAATNGPKAARGAIQEAAKQARWEEATVGELAEAVLIDPLLPHAPSRPMVLLIDALDEGRVGSSNPVLDLLRLHLLRLPDWVRIVVTGRPEQDVLSVQAALSSGEPEVLEPSAEQNRNDLRQFISARLSSAMPEEDRAAAIEALLEKSEGVFAYIAKMIDLVHTDSKTRSMTLGQLPQGLSALYSDYLSRQFVHGGDLDESALKHLRGFVLPLLTVAQEPLPVDLLRHLLAEVPSCDVIIGRLGSLFPIAADGTVTAFHKSVLDWLLSNASGEWHVDKTGAHKVHAMVWKHIIEAAQQIGPEDPEACLKAIGTYCVRHALTHFLLAMRGGDASPATSSLHFIAATAHAGEVLRLLRGAAQASNAGRSSSLAAPRAWIRTFASALMVDSGLVVECATLANTINSKKGLKARFSCLKTMQGLPDYTVLSGHPQTVSILRWSTDASHIATACRADAVVRLFDACSGAMVLSIRTHPSSGRLGHVSDLHFVSESAVVTASLGGEVKIWSAEHGELLAYLQGPIFDLDVQPEAPAGALLAVSVQAGVVAVTDQSFIAKAWDVGTRELIGRCKAKSRWTRPGKDLLLPTAEAWLPELHPSGNLLAVAELARSSNAFVYDLASGDVVFDVPESLLERRTTAMEFSADGAFFLLGTDTAITVWSTADWEDVAHLPLNPLGTGVPTPPGVRKSKSREHTVLAGMEMMGEHHLVACWGTEGVGWRVRRWDLREKVLADASAESWEHSTEGFKAKRLRMCSAADHVLVVDSSGAVRRCNVFEASGPARFIGHMNGSPHCLAGAPEAVAVASGTKVRVWPSAKKRAGSSEDQGPPTKSPMEPPAAITVATADAEHDLVAVGSRDGTLRFRNADGGWGSRTWGRFGRDEAVETMFLKVHDKPIISIAICGSADGRGSLVATAGGDSIAITDVTERKRVAELRAADAGGSPGPAIYVDMRQGGDVMAAFASGVAFCRWDTAKRDLCVSRFIPASAPITAVSWSADGKELLAASATGADIAVSLRSCETEESLGEWQCAHEVSSIAISHDRQRMACVGRRPAALGNDDNASLSVWLRTDLALRRLRYHLTSSSSDLPPSVAFSRDNYVVTGPRPVCVWNTMGAGASEEIVAPVLSILDLPSLARSMGAPGTHVSPCLLVAGAPDIDASAVCHISVPESSWYRFKSAARRLAPALSCAAAGGPCVAIALTSSQPDLKRRSIAHHEDRRDLQAAHNDGGGENAEKLQAACMESDFSAVSSLLKYDVTAAFCVDSHGWSPLDYAVRARSGEVIRALLEAGGERVRAESSMRRALWSSCECGFAEAVQLLAQSPMMSETDIDGASLLHAAVGSGDLETVRAVIEAGGNASVCSADWRGQTPLHIAAEVGKIELVRCLLAAGARSGQGDSAGETPLISAARWGHVGIVRELVEGGADRGAQNRTGETALHVAVQTAEGNSRELVDLLIQGAEGDLVNVERDGAVRVLHLAVLRRHAWLVQALIDAGAELDCPVHCAVNGVQEGSTPLLMAITLGDPEIAAVLARGGADVNRPFASGPQAGTTPIFWAATKKSAAMVKLLAEAGADVNCKNESGITPLLLACDGGDLEMAEALTSAGADASIRVEKTVMSINSSQMNQRDETEGFLRGDSALHCAISRGATDVAVHLIKSGAPIEIRTATMEDCEHPVGVGDARSPDFGATPLLRALHRGNSAVVSALLDAGADVMAADQYGVSALEVACSFGSNYIFDHKEEAAAHVEALVKAGAWRGQMGGQVPIIFLPIITANIELLKLMLSEGADASVQAFGRTTLHIALMADDQRTSYKAPESDTKGDIVEVLLAAGADADMPSSKEEDEVVCPLHLAADLGHTRIAKQLLAAGASCRCATSPGGLTPLHIAAAKCAHGVLDALIAAGADVHARNDVSDTPLLHAIRTTTAASSRPREARSVSESSHLDVIQELLKAGADPCAGGADGKTPLALIASGAAFPSTASLLLAAGARAADDDVFALLNRAFTDTAVAADILGAVLASGFDLSRHDGLGKTALHLAHSLFIKALATAGKQAYGETWAAVEERRQKILEGFAAVLQITSDNGAPVNAVDREGRSIADLLALEVVAAGRNGGQRWMGWSRIGAGKSERDMLVVVLEKGGKLEQNLGAHCLVAAASGLDASLTRALLGSGARPELTGDGLHALHALAEAAFETHGSQEKSRESFQETLAMLLGAGADVDTPRPADGYTPLMIAIRSGPSDEGSFKVEQLLKSGASGSSVGADGDTVLHVAIKSGFAANAGAFDSLLKAGASASAGVMGAEGRRPIGLLGAWHYPRRSVLETLEAMGGKATAKERSIIMLELLQKGLGDPDFLSALLEESECDSSVTDAEGNTALHLAAGRRDLVQQGDVISLLVGCGLSATAVNHSGKSPLALLGDELPNGLSPSRQAAFGTAKSASALVMAGADPGPLAPKLLGIAAASSDVRLIKSLTTQWGATASAPVDSSGATALHAIAALGAAGEPLTECIELLLAAGGKPNATADSGAAGGDGETDTGATPAGVPSPLLLALRNKNGGDIIAPVLVKAGMLLDKGEPMLWKVLSEACQGERGRVPERVLAVVQTGVVDGEDGAQSLCAAAMLQCPGLIELLLSRGVSPDAGILPGTEISSMLQAQIGEACNGMSCVHLAVIGANGGSIDALEALLKAGANVDARDGAMATPLHWAARLGLGTAVEALLRKGANPDAVASKGWTPLGLAAGVGSLETVQALVKGGCNKSLESSEPNVEGEPVLATEIARRNGHSDIVVFLQTG